MHSNNLVVQRSGTFGGMGLTQEGWPARSRPSCLLHPANLCQSLLDQGCSRRESRTNHAEGTDTELRCGRCQRGDRRLRCTRSAVPPDPAALMAGGSHEGVSTSGPRPHERPRCSSRSFLLNPDVSLSPPEIARKPSVAAHPGRAAQSSSDRGSPTIPCCGPAQRQSGRCGPEALDRPCAEAQRDGPGPPCLLLV